MWNFLCLEVAEKKRVSGMPEMGGFNQKLYSKNQRFF